MTNVDSLKDFFFNLIPGVAFLLFCHYLDFFEFKEGVISIVTLVVLGFSLGFVFDAVYVWIRKQRKIDNLILCGIFENDKLLKKLFENSVDKLRAGLSLKKDEVRDKLKVIYLMDHSVTGKGYDFHAVYAITRASFWGNFYIASLISLLMIIGRSMVKNTDFDLVATLLILASLVISKSLFFMQRKRYFSCVINSFAMSELYKDK